MRIQKLLWALGVICLPLHLPGSVFTVTNNLDSGTGSLRQAITDANAVTPGTNTIAFNIPAPGVQIISVLHQLPVITNAMIIDGTTQPGYAGTPLIALNGNSLFASACGLVIAGNGSTVRALTIQRFKLSSASSHGILIQGGGGNVVAGCFIGTETNGITQQFNNGAGVWISNSVNNVIGGTNAADRNLISGNIVCGVLISDGATSNQVLGNIIGLGIAGTNAVANNRGVVISNTPNNIIGGTVPGARNVISGQTDHEVLIIGLGASGNVVAGNYIGTRADGTALSTNNVNFDGVSVNNAPSNTIGGTVAAARNVLSGNNNGVTLLGTNSYGNVIQGNYIGTDASGTIKNPQQIRHPGDGAQWRFQREQPDWGRGGRSRQCDFRQQDLWRLYQRFRRQHGPGQFHRDGRHGIAGVGQWRVRHRCRHECLRFGKYPRRHGARRGECHLRKSQRWPRYFGRNVDKRFFVEQPGPGQSHWCGGRMAAFSVGQWLGRTRRARACGVGGKQQHDWRPGFRQRQCDWVTTVSMAFFLGGAFGFSELQAPTISSLEIPSCPTDS